MSFGKAPTPPDPTATSNTQQQYNTQAAGSQNAINSYGQSTPFGSTSYVPDPSSPSGFRLVTDTNATGHTLLNTADTLASNSAGMYSQPFNAGTETAKKLNQWSGDYVQPIFNQQDSNLEGRLRNQGLTPGSEAYNNAKNLLSRNQGDFTINYLKQNQGQAFDQALQEYQQPLQTIGGLRANAMPGAFQQTPTAQIQPANFMGATQSNYDAQLKNYENNANNWAKLGVAGIGLAAAPFTGGTSLLGTMGGMFGGNSGMTYGSPSGPTAFYGGNTKGGWG